MRVSARVSGLVLLAACSSVVPAGPDAVADAGPDAVEGGDVAAPGDVAPGDVGADRGLPFDVVVVPDTGACDATARCPSGFCFDGRCVCMGTLCGGVCAFTARDPSHCGACGRACAAPRSACVDGACACPEGTCGEACTPTDSDDRNCGACGRRCGERERCVFGACACAEGYGACGASAACDTALRDNPLHCGGCGARCVDGERCEGARCVLTTCRAGTADCERPEAPCETDLHSASAHCGACGRACGAGAACVAGRCASRAVAMQAPGSMLAATSARPWFRWGLGAGVDGVRLQVCADAACARRELEVDVTGERHRPATGFAAGVHFWRVFARRGAAVDATPGPVWAFVVPPAEASGAADAPPLLDLDGDGVGDEVSWAPVGWRVYGFRVRYGAGPDGARRPDVLVTSERTDANASLESGRVVVHPAGDLDGDGLGDAVVEIPYSQRLSPMESNGAIRLVALFGSRVGGPSIQPRVDQVGRHHPGPTLEGGIALGNAPGPAGFLALVGNSPHCTVYRLGPTPSDPPGGAWCGQGVLTAGDYDADGRVEPVYEREPSYVPILGAPTTTPRVCPGGPTLSADPSWRALTVDVDVDGYDDLVIIQSAPRSRYVIHGGPGGLDGTRCSTLP